MWQVDAFASALFEGNPAAVVVLPEWIGAGLMQAIAMENNLSETAFVVGSGSRWAIRWFTPTTEVDLCGHATLAVAHVIGGELEREAGAIEFGTMTAAEAFEPAWELASKGAPVSTGVASSLLEYAEDLESLPGYSEFAKSPQFREWQIFQKATAAPDPARPAAETNEEPKP